jgi:hypothetical protein
MQVTKLSSILLFEVALRVSALLGAMFLVEIVDMGEFSQGSLTKYFIKLFIVAILLMATSSLLSVRLQSASFVVWSLSILLTLPLAIYLVSPLIFHREHVFSRSQIFALVIMVVQVIVLAIHYNRMKLPAR